MARSNNQNDPDKAAAPRKHRRRASGEGSVYQRKSDKRWVASIPLEDGTRREYYFKKQQDAVAKLQQAQYEKKQGLLATGPHQTVKQFLETWLNIHSPNLRSTSYAAYEQLIRNHITPAIGHIQLQKLTSQHVQTLYSQRLKDGYAPETVRAIHRMLHRAFSDAVEWKLIGYNVCAKGKVKQPRRVKHEIQPLTKEQAQALLAAAKGHWFLEALLTLAIATGMRRGELLALRWSDVDFAGQCLYVRRTVTRIGSKGLVKGLVESEPKTESSKRRILLPRFVLEALHLHRERQAQMRSLTEDWQDHDLVFSGKQGRYIEVTDLRFHFKKLLRKAGLPDIRIHDLRHSAATILLEMKVQPKLVQELLGHSNIGITMDLYSHVLPSMQRKMMEDLDDFFRDS